MRPALLEPVSHNAIALSKALLFLRELQTMTAYKDVFLRIFTSTLNRIGVAQLKKTSMLGGR